MDPLLLEQLGAARVPLDICPTSNVMTGAVASLGAHPIRRLLAAGIAVSIGSDDPIVFGTSVTSELALLHLAHGFSWAELRDLMLHAAANSFLPSARRAALAELMAAAWS